MKDGTQAKKILIVDDEPDILEFLQYNLRKEGYQVITASDGQQAIQVAEREKPHLILLDIMMPEMDGVEACRLLRSRKEFDDTPIAFLTARDEDFSRGQERDGEHTARAKGRPRGVVILAAQHSEGGVERAIGVQSDEDGPVLAADA